MSLLPRISLAVLAVSLGICAHYGALSAQETKFQYEVNTDGINIRCDSTVTSAVVCNLKRGETLDVVSEAYGWYKVRLPAHAPAFIHKSMVTLAADNQSATVVKDNVNIRLGPVASSAVLGKVHRDKTVVITADQGDWYGIQPPSTAYGWVNKKFVSKTIKFAAPPAASAVPSVAAVPPQAQAPSTAQPETLQQEGVIKPYGFFFKGPFTHKLLTADNRVFLLKADAKVLDSLNNRKVKLTGVIVRSEKQKYPVLEIRGIEELQ
ncbi:MAG TPA: SH3 domain-containing protein [Patescibacteria group bacterium]|nr:SH3 domain-containing protein [Patescibacteria group bacterium]